MHPKYHFKIDIWPKGSFDFYIYAKRKRWGLWWQRVRGFDTLQQCEDHVKVLMQLPKRY